MSTKEARLTYLPALDGIRAFAVIAVVLFHAEFPFAPGGFLGVSVFFTLSGFLITSLLLVEYTADRHISLGAFYRRRIRRLLPAAWICIALVLLATPWWNGGQRDALTGDALAAIGHVANWRAAFSSASYQELFATSPSPLAHFWSLAIEEQFYLLLPLVAGLSLRWGRRVFAAVMASALVASIGAAAATTSFDLAYNGTHVRAAELLVGVGLALAIDRWRRTGRSLPPWIGRICAPAGIVGLIVLVGTADLTDTWLVRGGLVGVAALSAALIAGAHTTGPVTAVLSAPPLVAIGKVSYGIYLFHWPIFVLLTPERSGVDGAPLAAIRLAAVAAVTVVSYLAIEQPIRTGRALSGVRSMTFVGSTGAMALVIGAFVLPVPSSSTTDELLTAGDSGIIRFDDVAATTTSTAAPAPARSPSERPVPAPAATAPATTIPEPDPYRVLVVGSDEHAVSAIERFGHVHDVDIEVVSAVQPGCPVAGGQQVLLGDGSVIDIGDCEPSYDRIRTVVAERFESPPDLVVVSTGPIDEGLIQRTADERQERLDLAEIGARRGAADLQVQQITQVLSEQGAPVILAWWGDDGAFLSALQRIAVSRPAVVGVSTDDDELDVLLESQVGSLLESHAPADSGEVHPERVLVLGDSTSLIFARALHDASPSVDVLWAGENGCPVVRAARLYPRLNRPGTELHCADHATKLPPLLDEFDPGVIVIVAGPTELAAIAFGGDDTPRLPGDGAWVAHHDAEMASLLAVIDGGEPRASGVPVLIADSPPIGAGAFSTREMTYSSRLTGWNDQVARWAATHDGVDVLAYGEAISGFEAERGSIRPDGVHPDVALLTELVGRAFVGPIIDAAG